MSERKEHRTVVFILWFTPQMHATASTGPRHGRSQKILELQHGCQEHQCLSQCISSVCSQLPGVVTSRSILGARDLRRPNLTFLWLQSSQHGQELSRQKETYIYKAHASPSRTLDKCTLDLGPQNSLTRWPWLQSQSLPAFFPSSPSSHGQLLATTLHL